MRGPFLPCFYCKPIGEITCQLYFVWFVWFGYVWGLTRYKLAPAGSGIGPEQLFYQVGETLQLSESHGCLRG